MEEKFSGILNYLISIAFLLYALFALKKKMAEEPQMKLFGMPVKTILNIVYAGLAINIIVIIITLMM